MPNVIIKIASIKHGLPAKKAWLQKNDGLIQGSYHHLRSGRIMDCSDPNKMVGQSGRQTKVGFFSQRGIHSMQFTREAALSKDQFMKFVAILYAAREMPQALLSDEWIQANEIEVQMRQNGGSFGPWKKVTLAGLEDFTASVAGAKQKSDAKSKAQPTVLAQPKTIKYHMNKSQKRSLAYIAGSGLLIAAGILANMFTPIPYLVLAVQALGFLAGVNIFRLITSSIVNHVNYKGQGILAINEKAFVDPVAVRQIIVDLGLGKGISLSRFPCYGLGTYRLEISSNANPLFRKLVQMLKPCLQNNSGLNFGIQGPILFDLVEQVNGKPVICLYLQNNSYSLNRTWLIKLQGLGCKREFLNELFKDQIS